MSHLLENNNYWTAAIEDADLDDVGAYDYDLPDAQIATDPAHRRDHSRLLVMSRKRALIHDRFENIGGHLQDGDLLIFNNTRVVPARVQVFKETGGKVELFILQPQHGKSTAPWDEVIATTIEFECITGSSKPLRPDMILGDPARPDLPPIRILSAKEGRAVVEIPWERTPLEFLDAFGEVPLPPYIVKQRKESGRPAQTLEDLLRYQTVFASVAGAVAAPTAGLHFTRELLQTLEDRGVSRAELTLTVGPGTFQPVRADRLSGHEMHREDYFIPPGLADSIEDCRSSGGRVIAVGTTSARALEAEARRSDPFEPGWRSTDIFLKPGGAFEVCQGLITNFHLPRSTLLALVAGFVGYPEMRHLYNVAVSQQYRFYSYGDASLLFRD